MRHTRNRQLKKFNSQYIIYCIGNLPIDFIRKYAYEDMHLDTTFKWHSEAVSKNFWSNWRKSCVSFKYKTFLQNDVGMATKYLPTKGRN